MLVRPALTFFAFAVLASSQNIDAFFKNTFDEVVRNDPEFATLVGRHEYDDKWTDWSRGGREHRHQFFQERLGALNKFPPQTLSREDRVTFDLVRYDFESRLDAWDVQTHLLRVGQLFGFHNA